MRPKAKSTIITQKSRVNNLIFFSRVLTKSYFKQLFPNNDNIVSRHIIKLYGLKGLHLSFTCKIKVVCMHAYQFFQ